METQNPVLVVSFMDYVEITLRVVRKNRFIIRNQKLIISFFFQSFRFLSEEPSTGQDLYNDHKNVKIGCLEPRFSCRQQKSLKKKKIWCASRARVNLPHIGNRKCIKFVQHRNLLKMQRSTFLIGRYLVKYQNFEFLFLFLDAKIVTKTGILFVIRWNLLSKTQVLTFLSRNLYKRY
jgi:hypothetical protein